MPAEGKYVVGPFLIDCQRRTVCRGEVELDLHWRSFLALRALLEADGEVVDKIRLIDLLWSGATVEESNLHKYISQLRRVLNEADPTRDYIETVPRIGYRLAVPAAKMSSGEPAQPVPGRSMAIPVVAVAAAALAIPGAILWWDGRGLPTRPDCEQAYSAGMDLLRRRDLPSVRNATNELRRAVQACPSFAKGWAGLAEASSFLHPEDTSTCLDLARRSVSLDPECGECHAILGFILFARHWSWDDADKHLGRAALLVPKDPQARYWAAQLEAAQGKPDKALRSIDEALRLSPEGLNLLVMKAGVLYFARDYGRSVHVADQALAVNLPGAWQWRARSLFLAGRKAEAVRSLAFELGSWSSMSAEGISRRASLFTQRYREDGLEGPLGDLLSDTAAEDVAEIQSFNRATWLMLLGRTDEALRELERAVGARIFDLIYLGVDPLFDPLRDNVRFREVLRKIGIAT